MKEEQLEIIYRLFEDVGEVFEYEYDDYIVNQEDLKSINDVQRRPKQIYVHNDHISLFIRPLSASLHAWPSGLSSAANGKLFITLDDLLQKQRTFWRLRNIFIIAIISWSGFPIAWIPGLPPPLSISGLIFSAVSSAFWMYGALIHRNVKIIWVKRQHWIPNPGQIISSVIAILIASSIVFVAGAYLSPHIKPFLDRLMSITAD